MLSSTSLKRNKSDLRLRNKSPLLTARYQFESSPFSTSREKDSTVSSKNRVSKIECSALVPPPIPPPRVDPKKQINKDLKQCLEARRASEQRKPSSFRRFKNVEKRRPAPPPMRPPYSVPMSEEVSSIHSARSQKSIIIYAQNPTSAQQQAQQQKARDVRKIKREQLKFGLDNLDFSDLDSAF